MTHRVARCGYDADCGNVRAQPPTPTSPPAQAADQPGPHSVMQLVSSLEAGLQEGGATEGCGLRRHVSQYPRTSTWRARLAQGAPEKGGLCRGEKKAEMERMAGSRPGKRKEPAGKEEGRGKRVKESNKC